MMEVIYAPDRLDRDEISDFVRNLDRTRDFPEVSIDFSRLKYSRPTGMLVVGSKIREWAMYRHNKGLKQKKVGIDARCQCHSYLMNIGFFDFVYMDEGKCVGEARGNDKCLPITRIQRPNFNPFDQSIQEWYEMIQN